MNRKILAIIAKIISDAGLGIEGETLFTHHMVSEVKKGVLIKPPFEGVDVDDYLPGYYVHGFQLIVRAQTYEEGEPYADQLIEAVRIRQETDFVNPGTSDFIAQIKYLRPLKLPIAYPRSDSGDLEWSINFQICYVVH
jgi:hypothetical protein